MDKKELPNIFLLLEIDPNVPWSQENFEIKIRTKQHEWVRLSQIPSKKGLDAKNNLGMLSVLRKIASDQDLRNKQAEEAKLHSLMDGGAQSLGSLSKQTQIARKSFKLFISYASADKKFAQRLSVDLKENGIATWIDDTGIRFGENWPDSIARAIEDCYAVLVILSPKSVESKWVNRELAFADQKGKIVFPLVYEVCNLPRSFDLRFGNVQRADFTIGSYKLNFEKLLISMKDILDIKR